jgi:elongation factor P hydroxylase
MTAQVSKLFNTYFDVIITNSVKTVLSRVFLKSFNSIITNFPVFVFSSTFFSTTLSEYSHYIGNGSTRESQLRFGEQHRSWHVRAVSP